MNWQVTISRRAAKQAGKLPKAANAALQRLMAGIEETGPVRGDWPNYARLADGSHHCHLKKGKPTYVAVWVEKAGDVRLVEVKYVGTHEKAPY